MEPGNYLTPDSSTSLNSQELISRIKDVGRDFPDVLCVAIDLVPMAEFVFTCLHWAHRD